MKNILFIMALGMLPASMAGAAQATFVDHPTVESPMKRLLELGLNSVRACKKGKPCGDSCIAKEKRCTK